MGYNFIIRAWVLILGFNSSCFALNFYGISLKPMLLQKVDISPLTSGVRLLRQALCKEEQGCKSRQGDQEESSPVGGEADKEPGQHSLISRDHLVHLGHLD